MLSKAFCLRLQFLRNLYQSHGFNLVTGALLKPLLLVSVARDDRKRPTFRPSEQISARFFGKVSALQPTHSSPLLPMSAQFSIVSTRERVSMARPSPKLLIFTHFRRRWPPGSISCRQKPDDSFLVGLRV